MRISRIMIWTASPCIVNNDKWYMELKYEKAFRFMQQHEAESFFWQA